MLHSSFPIFFVLQKTVNASEPDEVEKTIKPFGESEIYVANEAYS